MSNLHLIGGRQNPAPVQQGPQMVQMPLENFEKLAMRADVAKYLHDTLESLIPFLRKIEGDEVVTSFLADYDAARQVVAEVQA